MVCARLVLAALAALSIGATRAEARVWVGVGVPLYYGPPVYVPPPVYYPPPVIYAPPPGYYGPPPGSTFNYTPPSAMPQSYPPQGYAPQGYAPQGYPPSGYPPSGYPPPGYGAPRGVTPQSYTPSMGNGPTNLNLSCHAGIYTCPLVEDTPPGGQCACPNEKGGTIAGRAS